MRAAMSVLCVGGKCFVYSSLKRSQDGNLLKPTDWAPGR